MKELESFIGLDFSMHPNFRDITDYPKRNSKKNKENFQKW